MYARTVASRMLTFGVSGMLYKDGLVMYDRDTDTLWAQVDGRAIRGALFGRQLEIVPSVHATWKEWLALYPQSKVMKKRGEFRSAYERYNRNPSQLGVLGRKNLDKRLPPKERVLGIRADDAATAFPVKAVRDARLVHAQVGLTPFLLVAAAPDRPVLVYDRRVGMRVLQFTLETRDGKPTLRDAETGTVWDVATGEAVAGKLQGARLLRATAVPAFWFAWRSYFPQTAVWQLAAGEGRP